MDLENLNLMA